MDVYAVNAVPGEINGLKVIKNQIFKPFKDYSKRNLLKIMLFKLRRICQGLIPNVLPFPKIWSLEIC